MHRAVPRSLFHHVFRALAALTLLLGACAAWAHAYPRQQTPAAKAELVASPPEVRIRFDDALEPAFSSLSVTDAAGYPVSKNKSRVDAGNPHIMTVALPPLPSDTYRVHWVAVAHDGHRTQGDYSFQVK